METMLQTFTLADTDDFSFSKHIKNAMKKKIKEEADKYLRDHFEEYDKFRDLQETAEKYAKNMRGNFKPEFFAEMTTSAGGVIQKITITVSASFCCCKDGKYIFKKAKATRSTIEYKLSLKSPSEEALKRIRNLSNDVAKASLSAVEDLKASGCR